MNFSLHKFINDEAVLLSVKWYNGDRELDAISNMKIILRAWEKDWDAEWVLQWLSQGA